MAPRKRPSTSKPTLIGNCEVVVVPNAFTSKSTRNFLQISVSKNAKISISAKEGTDHTVRDSKSGLIAGDDAGEEDSSSGNSYYFVLINPKVADEHGKVLLQEALDIYLKQLPGMHYAANTGKESMFLERCVFSGKYCTLVLKSDSLDGHGEVIAAISYQMIPADTHYAEIPIAAVSSAYQHKGIGQLLFLELKKRLQGVGISTIFCWGDTESEGFWLKQGFITVAEVDKRGRSRRLPVRAEIRRSLCFPGGSTLMVSHLQDSLANASKLAISLKPYVNPPSNTVLRKARIKESDHTLTGLNQMSPYMGNPQSEASVKAQCGLKDVSKADADIGVNHCSCTAGKCVKRSWEASQPSLKSKKIKGGHAEGASERRLHEFSFNGCTMCTCIDESLVEVTTGVPLTTNFSQKNKQTNLNGKGFRVMLMNIADDFKRKSLMKIIEDLGGIATSDGRASTHVITGKARKTLNFCTALCSGAWIVSPTWLKESFRQGRFLDERSYILKDEDYEWKHKKELKDAVLEAKAKPQGLLKGYDVCIAAHVEPPAETLWAIISSAGGNVIGGMEEVREVEKTILVACQEDMEEALMAVKRGVWTFSSDWLMNCVMRQELDLGAPQFAESL